MPNPSGLLVPQVRGIAADGSAVAVKLAEATGGPVGHRWTGAGGWQPVGIASELSGISADGSTYLGQEWVSTPPNPHFGRAFYWRPPAAPAFLDEGTAQGASANGSVIVGSRWNPVTQRMDAYRWTAAGGYLSLPHLIPQGYAQATGISADGSVVVGWDQDPSPGPPEVIRGFVWTAAGVREIPSPPGASSVYVLPQAVSANGRVVVGHAKNAADVIQAFVWTEAVGARFLNMPVGVSGSFANAVSSDGSVIVGIKYPPVGLPSGFIWDRARGTRDLRQVLLGLGATNLGDALLLAHAVSADGGIIAGATNHSGAPFLSQVFLAHVPAFCYANCDGSTVAPALNVADFVCFLTRFSAGDAYANCDLSSTPPTLNVADFVCFQQRFAAGCR